MNRSDAGSSDVAGADMTAFQKFIIQTATSGAAADKNNDGTAFSPSSIIASSKQGNQQVPVTTKLAWMPTNQAS